MSSKNGYRRKAGCALRRGGLVAGLLLGTVAGAADENEVIFPGSATRTEKAADKAAGPSLHSMSIFLGLALAGAGGWMVWRNRRSVPAGRERRALAIDETRSLGNRQYLVVASYEGQKFLLGVCPGRIDLLSGLNGAPAGKPVRE